MFNKSPYNRAPYNRRASFVFEWTAMANAEGTSGGPLLITRYMDGDAGGGSAAYGAVVRAVLPAGAAEALAEPKGDFVRTLVFSGAAEAAGTGEGACVSAYGQETLTVSGLDMRPGDELIIDTDHMTVTLNGANIVDRVEDDSIFFKLKSGVNDIVVEGAAAADIKVLWKDRWL